MMVRNSPEATELKDILRKFLEKRTLFEVHQILNEVVYEKAKEDEKKFWEKFGGGKK